MEEEGGLSAASSSSTTPAQQQAPSRWDAAYTPPMPIETLRQQFALQNFRAGQLEAILAILKSNDVCIFWATGSGKSLIYLFPALHLHKIVIVVSPLLSLINDQVKNTNARFKREVALSFASGNASQDAMRKICTGESLLFFITPERLNDERFTAQAKHIHENVRPIALVAVDEAHFLSSQGFEFRPSYRKIADFREHFPAVPFAALTATAPPLIRKDIVQTLRLRNPVTFTSSYDKPNLVLAVKLQPKKLSIDEIVRRCSSDADGATIVFTFTRKDAETLHAEITRRGTSQPAKTARLYHGQVPYETRELVQRLFNAGDIQIVVATGSSFGVGIDIGNIRNVLILGYPKSFEDYYQQIGRAGRDGKMANATMFVSASDHMVHIKRKKPTDKTHLKFDRTEKASVRWLVGYAKNTRECRRAAVLKYWGQGDHAFRCGNCDNCKRA